MSSDEEIINLSENRRSRRARNIPIQKTKQELALEKFKNARAKGFHREDVTIIFLN